MYLYYFKGKELKKRGDGRESIESYENAFRDIEEITGHSDIDYLVANFILGLYDLIRSHKNLQ